jgi:hypothetical protein
LEAQFYFAIALMNGKSDDSTKYIITSVKNKLKHKYVIISDARVGGGGGRRGAIAPQFLAVNVAQK